MDEHTVKERHQQRIEAALEFHQVENAGQLPNFEINRIQEAMRLDWTEVVHGVKVPEDREYVPQNEDPDLPEPAPLLDEALDALEDQDGQP